MKENYIELILNNNDNVLLQTMFSLVWQQRENNSDPEEKHPDWETVGEAYKRLCVNPDGSDNLQNYDDLWDVLRCFCETYYLIGLRQGLSSTKRILPCIDILNNPFSTEGDERG